MRNIAQKNKARIWEVDFLRGACLILMMLHHWGVIADFFYYLWEPFMKPSGFVDKLCLLFIDNSVDSAFVEEYMHERVIALFFGLAGLSTGFSNKPYKSLLKTALFAAGVSVASYALSVVAAMPGLFVSHGVFHMFAICYLVNVVIAVAFREKYSRIAVFWGLAVFLFILNNAVNADPHLIKEGSFYDLIFRPWNLEQSLDHFSLMPWFGYFLIGAGLSPLLYPKKRGYIKKLSKIPYLPISFLGRHPVPFYALHIVFGLLFFFLLGLVAVPREWLSAVF